MWKNTFLASFVVPEKVLCFRPFNNSQKFWHTKKETWQQFLLSLPLWRNWRSLLLWLAYDVVNTCWLDCFRLLLWITRPYWVSTQRNIPSLTVTIKRLLMNFSGPFSRQLKMMWKVWNLLFSYIRITLHKNKYMLFGKCLKSSQWSMKALKPLREKCPNIEFFRSVFSRVRTEYGKIWNTEYSVFWHFTQLVSS